MWVIVLKKLAIIGAGASGLSCAIEARRGFDIDVTVFERAQRAGRKIMASGNGRCNLTNDDLDIRYYHGAQREFMLPAFEKYGLDSTLDFFLTLGVPVRREGTRIYPYSLQSGAVLDALRYECAHLGVNIICEKEIKSIEKNGSGWLLDGAYFDAVVIACGGIASQDLGGTESGYTLLEKLGHKRSELLPSIVQLRTDSAQVKGLSGIKQQAVASLFISGRFIDNSEDEVLFVDYGLSGPAIFQLSSRATRALAKKEEVFITLDIVPEYTFSDILSMLEKRIIDRPYISLEDFLTGLLHKRVGQMALKSAGIAPLSRQADTLNAKELRTIASLLKKWRFDIVSVNSMKNAQVTAGGIFTRDFDPNTMMSKKAAGVFACGEVLDIDGDCGGYNLQWAWSSGRLAGHSAAEFISR